MIINVRKAELSHILDQAQQRTLMPNDSSSPVSIELFDTLDCMSFRELREVMALFLYGQDTTLLNFEAARQKANEIGWNGVGLLHQNYDLHVILKAGVVKLEKEGSVAWII